VQEMYVPTAVVPMVVSVQYKQNTAYVLLNGQEVFANILPMDSCAVQLIQVVQITAIVISPPVIVFVLLVIMVSSVRFAQQLEMFAQMVCVLMEGCAAKQHRIVSVRMGGLERCVILHSRPQSGGVSRHIVIARTMGIVVSRMGTVFVILGTLELSVRLGCNKPLG